MHYYIDGYNWLFRTPKSKLSFEERRREFVKEIYELVKDSSSLITLVFDSSDPSRDLYSKGNFKTLEIVFTPKKQTADEYIIESVGRAKHPHTIYVVTLDRELKDKCRLLGASVLSMKEFFMQFSKSSPKKETKKIYFDSKSQLERLLAIFEKRLKEDQE